MDRTPGKKAPERSPAPLLDVVLIVAFLLAIGVPAVMTAVSPAATSVRNEFRQPPRFPALALEREALRDFPGGFDAWFRDAFWTRPRLIRWHNATKLLALRVSPHPAIQVGKDGWLFLGGKAYVACTRGTDPFSAEELERWVDALATCDTWCRERGMDFLFFVAPNKATVYPELLPAGYEQVGPTRMDQLFGALRERTQVGVLDMRPLLADAKRRRQHELYYPLGTHWNGLGAEVAYRAILEWTGERHPGVAPLPPRGLLRSLREGGDSWAPKLYLADALHQTDAVVKHPAHADLRRQPLPDVEASPGRGNQLILAPKRDAPRLFVLHDSFGPWLVDLIAPHFSCSMWMWSESFPVDVIERGKPDVVVFQMVERLLHQAPPDPARLVWPD